MMRYHVYTVNRREGYYKVTKNRHGLTRQEAEELKALRMANPNRQCDYVIVAVARVKEFFAMVEEKNAIAFAIMEEEEKRKQAKWDKLAEMYKKGYKVKDTVEFVNR